MLNEAVDALKIIDNGIYVDGTLGGAGHSTEICKKLNGKGVLIGIDQDMQAIEAAIIRLNPYIGNVRIVNNNFKNIKEILNSLDIKNIDGMLLDLGVSSHQLDEGERGFSFRHDSWLDMRMDRNTSLTAHAIVNSYSEDELTKIIYDYGEEKWAKRIAQFIVRERNIKSIDTTFELVEVIKKAVPKGARDEGKHPATRTFQAIRIAVNDELGILEKAITDVVEFLNVSGRLAIITFHSLEDRIVKQIFAKLALGCKCPSKFPICICGQKPKVRLVTKKPIIPSGYELSTNPRSRSAKLRVVEKL